MISLSIDQIEIVWSKDYELGDSFVDNQHKRLFELVSNISKSCHEGGDIKTLSETLDFLIQYTVQHFGDEEALQIRCNFPEYEYHKKLHEEFEAIVSEKVKEFMEKGEVKDLSDTVNDFVVTWLENHILKEDMKIRAYLKNI